MATGGCGEAKAVNGMAAELFQLASLLVGDEEQALRTIESSLANMGIDPCLDPESARSQARASVVRGALRQMAAKQPEGLAPQAPAAAANPCVQDDDLDSAGLSQEQLREWLEQGGEPERRREFRAWLEDLPAAQRAVFVQRAVLGNGNEAVADVLRETGGAPADSWTPEDVRQTFRLALCSLANSLAHAQAADGLPA